MPEFTVSFEVYCGKCGAGLCNNSRGEERRGTLRVTVDPCEACLASEKDEGDTEGYNRGLDEGFAKGERSTLANANAIIPEGRPLGGSMA